jgi:hypothetical protein
LEKSTFFLGLRKKLRKRMKIEKKAKNFLPPNRGEGGKKVKRESTNKL